MADDAYLQHRPLVMRLAYDITGSWAEAEDVAQEAWLRWRSVTGPVHNERAYLARIATHLALDAVAARERRGYVGPFLPEPVPTGPGADEAVAVAAEVEVALMVVLGALSPLERAAFLLHDVFAFSHAEVADLLGRDPAAVRQLASRARRRVEAHREAITSEPALDPKMLMELTGNFMAAARRGDLDALKQQLTDDVVFIGDGGGLRTSALRPIHGPDKVARLFAGLAQSNPNFEMRPVLVNHRLAMAVYIDGALDQVLWLIGRGDRLAQVLAVRNPHKLQRLADGA